MGRHSEYTEEVGNRLCDLVAGGSTITAAAADCGIAPPTVAGWADRYPIFRDRLARARDVGVDVQAESLLSIADAEPDVQRARLKSDNLRWLLSKIASRKYGDRMEINLTETISVSGALEAARARLLRPVCDQLEQQSTQLIEQQSENDSGTPDKQSDASQAGDDDDLLC